jgi:hypothetical protein
MARALALLPTMALFLISGCGVTHDTSKGRTWGETRLGMVDAGSGVRRCTQAFAVMDDAVHQAGRRDAQAAHIPGFPHLRTTRFLAALGARFQRPRKDQNNEMAFKFWIGWLAETATKARAYELANLSPPARAALRSKIGKTPESVAEECTAILIKFDRRRVETREILAQTVNVPDNYVDVQRIVGIYPLTALAVLMGFDQWKERNLPSFTRASSDPKVGSSVIRIAPQATYSPMPAAEVAAVLRRYSDNPFNVPRPTSDALRRLAGAFAPVFAIDAAGEYDRIGAPAIGRDGIPGIDTTKLRVYIQPSWALFDGVPLLQISYLAWFSERPPTGDLDILAGRLDGVIWRVTIAPDGRPLLYDSIHACGCYHLFFPVSPTRLRDRQIDEPGEGTVVPAAAPTLGPGRRMVLNIGSGHHYLRRLSTMNNDVLRQSRYELVPMDALRSIPVATGGTRSLYGPNGIVVGTERRERFLLWPMGVPSAGAMRQWGTHATAFVGRRHFDDPYLIHKAFTR